MPIFGYLGIRDPGRISTITNILGEKYRRKKLMPLGLEPPVKSAQLSVRLYVRDCPSHEPRGGLVPVTLFHLAQGLGWEEVGVGRCCPLCWIIVIPPHDDFPVALPQPEITRYVTPKQSAALKAGRHRSGPTTKRSPLWQRIRDYASSLEPFSVQEIMDLTSMSRTAIRKIIVEMVKSDELKISESGGMGRGNRTLYEIKAP